MGPKERKEREKELRREEIIKAGEKLFLTKGLNGTTMEEIARECELSKGTLYLYFSSKEQLHFEIVFRAMDCLYQTMLREIGDAADPLEKLEGVGRGHHLFFYEHPEYFRILSRVMDIDHNFDCDMKDVGMHIQKKNAQIWELITSIIIEGIQGGIFKKDTDPQEIAISLYASTTMIMQIKDHVRRNEGIHKAAGSCHHGNEMEEPFGDINFDKVVTNIAWRIVMSIMTNPPAKIPNYINSATARGAKQ